MESPDQGPLVPAFQMARGPDRRLGAGQGPALRGVEAGPDSVCSAVHTGLDFVCLRRNGHRWARVRPRAGSCVHHRSRRCFAPGAWKFVVLRLSRAGSNEYSSQPPKRRGQPAPVRPPRSRERLWAVTQSERVLIFSCSPLLCSRSPGPLAWLRGRERKGLFDVKPREWLGRAGEWERLARAGAHTAPRRSCLRSCGAAAGAHRPGRRGLGPAGASLHPRGGRTFPPLEAWALNFAAIPVLRTRFLPATN